MTQPTEHTRTSPPPPQRRGIDHVVFGIAAGLSVLFVLDGALDNEGFAKTGQTILGWITGHFGWFFVLTSAGFVLFAIVLALSR